jgi:hypothetical protein
MQDELHEQVVAATGVSRELARTQDALAASRGVLARARALAVLGVLSPVGWAAGVERERRSATHQSECDSRLFVWFRSSCQ